MGVFRRTSQWEPSPAGYIVKFTVDDHVQVPMSLSAEITSIDEAIETFHAWLADVDTHGYRQVYLWDRGERTRLFFRPENVTSFEIKYGRLEWMPDPDDE